MEELTSNTEVEAKKCTNCDFETLTNFCPECGNPMTVKKLSFANLLKDTIGQIYGFDGRFLQTIKGLTIKPHGVIKGFIQGNRKKYIGPVSYYFLLYAILLIYTSMVDVDLSVLAPQSEDMQRGMGLDPSKQSSEQVQFQQELRGVIFKYIQYFGVIGFPFFALAGKWFYRKSRFTYIEHFVTAFYMHAQPLLLSFITVTVYKLTGNNVQLYFLFITFLYYFWTLSRTYSKKTNVLSFLKAFFFYAVYYIMYIIIVSIGIVVVSNMIR